MCPPFQAQDTEILLLRESIEQLECEHASVTAALKQKEEERATIADTCERLERDMSHMTTAIKVWKVSHTLLGNSASRSNGFVHLCMMKFQPNCAHFEDSCAFKAN